MQEACKDPHIIDEDDLEDDTIVIKCKVIHNCKCLKCMEAMAGSLYYQYYYFITNTTILLLFYLLFYYYLLNSFTFVEQYYHSLFLLINFIIIKV